MPAKREERTLAFSTLAAVLIPPFSAMADIRVQHADRLPHDGAFVLAPNHHSEIDPIIMGMAVWRSGRAPRFLAKASLWKVPIVRWALTASGQIPVERAGTARNRDPKATARRIAADGSAVVIYPEGTLTREPNLWPMRGKSGAVRMAIDAQIPLIPAAHWGAQRLFPRYGKRMHPFPRKRIDVVFGEPIDLSMHYGTHVDAATVTRLTDELMARIAALLGELRGEQPPAERWDPSKNNQSETGRFDG